MAGRDFEPALDTHVAWGVELLDLKECICCISVAELTLDEARRAAGQIAARELKVYAFSMRNMRPLEHVLELARILKPAFICLLGAQTRRRMDLPDAVACLQAALSWVLPAYRQAVDAIHAAGFRYCIESEVSARPGFPAQEVSRLGALNQNRFKV